MYLTYYAYLFGIKEVIVHMYILLFFGVVVLLPTDYSISFQ